VSSDFRKCRLAVWVFLIFESFVTAFIIYFVVIDPIGNAPVFLSVTSHLDQKQKLRVAVEGAAMATSIYSEWFAA